MVMLIDQGVSSCPVRKERGPVVHGLGNQYIHHTIPVSHHYPIIIPIETSLSPHYPITMGYYIIWIDIYRHSFHGIMIHMMGLLYNMDRHL